MIKENTPLIMLAVYILWDFVKHTLKNKDIDLKENTEAIIVATNEIKNLNEKVALLSKLPKDVQNLALKIRAIETKLEV